MDKPQFLVIGILAVALGFFALRFTSSDSDDYDSPYTPSGDRYAMAGGGEYGDEPSRFGRGSSGGAGGMRDRGAGGTSRISRFGASEGRGPSGSGRGNTETVSGGSRDRGGRIGSAAGGRAGGSIRSANATGRLGGGSNSINRDRTRLGGSGNRADRADVLTDAEAAVDPFYNDNQLDDDPSDDVLLEVADKEDIDRKADDVEGVQEGEDGDWIDFSEDSVTTFPNFGNANPNAGTITMDIKPNWNGADITDNSLLQIREPHQWENRMQLVKNGQFLRFIVTDNTGHEADISFKIDQWVEGDAHNVTASWDNGVTTLYVDGKRVGTNNYPGKLEFQDTTPMHLGSDYANGGSYGSANGQFRKFQVFDGAKTPDEIG